MYEGFPSLNWARTHMQNLCLHKDLSCALDLRIYKVLYVGINACWKKIYLAFVIHVQYGNQLNNILKPQHTDYPSW